MSWGISDGDLFYAMIRSREQPGVRKFATLPELDHNIGNIIKRLVILCSRHYRSRNIHN